MLKLQRIYKGLRELLEDPVVMEEHGVTESDILQTSTTSFFEGGEDELTAPEWLEIIATYKKLNII